MENRVDNAPLKQRTQSEFGVSPHEVLMSFEQIANDGCLLMVHIDGLSIFRRGSTNAERGVVDGGIQDKHLTPGVTHCAPVGPAHKLSSLANSLYQNTNRYSFNLSSVEHAGFRGMRFLLFGALSREWRQNHDRYCAAFYETRDQMIEELSDYRDLIAHEWHELGEKSWQSIWLKARTDEVRVDGRNWNKKQKAEYIDHLVAHALASIPDAETIEKRVQILLETAVFSLTAKSEALTEMAKQASAKADAEEAVARRKKAELEKVQADDGISKIEQERAIMRGIVRQSLEAQIARMGDPRREMVAQLRDRMGADARETRVNIEANGRLYKPNVTRLENMIETYDAFSSSMAGADVVDASLEGLFGQLRDALAARAEDGKYDVAAIGGALGKIERLSAGKAAKKAAHDDLAARLKVVKPTLEDGQDED